MLYAMHIMITANYNERMCEWIRYKISWFESERWGSVLLPSLWPWACHLSFGLSASLKGIFTSIIVLFEGELKDQAPSSEVFLHTWPIASFVTEDELQEPSDCKVLLLFKWLINSQRVVSFNASPIREMRCQVNNAGKQKARVFPHNKLWRHEQG